MTLLENVMRTRTLQKRVTNRSLMNTRVDVPAAAIVLGAAGVGTYVGAQLGGPAGAAVGVAVGAFVGTLATALVKNLEVEIDARGRVKVKYQMRGFD